MTRASEEDHEQAKIILVSQNDAQAVTAIFGLAVATVLTLVVVQVLCTFAQRLNKSPAPPE